MKKLAIISTHPIQYNAPFFRKLAESGKVGLMVFYTFPQAAEEIHDPGFGKTIKWDIPLLEGYNYTFVKNTSKKPGIYYNGIVCPSLIEEITSWHPDAILVYGWNFHAHLRVMRHFKGKIPVWFRGDSTLLDYDFRSLKTLLNHYLNKNQEPGTILRLRSGTGNQDKNHLSNLKSQISNLESQIPNSTIDNRDSQISNPTSHVPRPTSLFSRPFKSYIIFKIRKLYLSYIYRSIDTAFYTGTRNKAYFLAHGIKENQLVKMPHVVDNEFFSSGNESRETSAKQWRRSLGISDDDFVVLFAGKLEPKKNPELLLNTIIAINECTIPDFQIFKFSNFQIHLLFVGNGILEPQLKLLGNTKSYIHFLPFQNQSQMPVVYRLGNVFCLPSQGPGETWGLALNEALACGRPVIASDKAGGAFDLITEGINGWLFKSNNPASLKSALLSSFNARSTNQNIKPDANSNTQNVMTILQYLDKI